MNTTVSAVTTTTATGFFVSWEMIVVIIAIGAASIKVLLI